jgi:hypothetical protein
MTFHRMKLFEIWLVIWHFFIKVWEIVAQSEPHVTVNLVEVGILIRYSISNINWWCTDIFYVCVFLMYFVQVINTWLLRFQVIVLRSFVRSWKCVGRKILLNVLYPLTKNVVNVILFFVSNVFFTLWWRILKWFVRFWNSSNSKLVIVSTSSCPDSDCKRNFDVLTTIH